MVCWTGITMFRAFMKAIPFFVLLILLPVMVFVAQKGYQLTSRAREVPASIVVDTSRVLGPLPGTWKALAQGGEEQGVQMLSNVITQTSELSPRYIRIDH